MRHLPRRLALVLSASLAACAAGPHQLRRSVDDWDHKTYVNSPWWNAALWLVPVIPVGHAVAMVGDFLITDPWAFWCEDAWDGTGTGYKHLQVEWTDGYMTSMWCERSGWTRVDR
ncbi:MAG: hypothetical protein WAT39_19380 [Planctomycetota bacterium]